METLKILIVDDVIENLNLYEAYLNSSAVELAFAQDGSQAVNKFKQNSFDIIFMDIQMPVVDGYEATRLIREIEQVEGRRPARILAYTSNVAAHEVEACFEAGCDFHLSKPIKKETLLQAIKMPVSPEEFAY